MNAYGDSLTIRNPFPSNKMILHCNTSSIIPLRIENEIYLYTYDIMSHFNTHNYTHSRGTIIMIELDAESLLRT